jgi:hypothetical protein
MDAPEMNTPEMDVPVIGTPGPILPAIRAAGPSLPPRVAAPARPQTAKAKPDPRPMRIALGAAGIAAFSALSAAIVMPPSPAVSAPMTYVQQPAPGGPGSVVAGQAPVLYVQLQPGQTAPPGARVITSTPAPAAAAPAAPAAPVAPKPIIVRTTQSGKVIP